MHVTEFLNNKLMYKCIHVKKIKLLAHIISCFISGFHSDGLRLLSSVTL